MSLEAMQSTLNGQEIAEALGKSPRQNVGDFEVEIIDSRPIPKGVELFARVWQNGQQIGFGPDGTVDIERFRFFNPPVLVPDGTKKLKQHPEFGASLVDNFKRDPKAAILTALAHTISVKKERFGPSKIERGRIGNTTSTFYPDPGTESTSVDGYTVYSGSSSFATTHDAVTGTGADDTDELYLTYDDRGADFRFFRLFTLFDTSAIPDTDEISAATLSLFHFTDNASDNNSDSVSIVASTPALNTAITTADYDQLGTTKFATDKTFASITAAQYYDWALNATGIAAISKTGVTKFGVRTALDIANTEPTGTGQRNFRGAAATANSSEDPKLVVEHAAAAVTKTVSDTLTLTTTALKALTRTVSDTLTLTTTALKALTRSVLDTLTLTTSIETIKVLVKTVSDTLTLTTSIIRSLSRTISDTLTLTTTASKSLARSILDTLTLTSAITSARAATLTVLDTLNLTTTLQKLLNGALTIWTNIVKQTTSWTNAVKNATSWINKDKSS